MAIFYMIREKSLLKVMFDCIKVTIARYHYRNICEIRHLDGITGNKFGEKSFSIMETSPYLFKQHLR